MNQYLQLIKESATKTISDRISKIGIRLITAKKKKKTLLEQVCWFPWFQNHWKQMLAVGGVTWRSANYSRTDLIGNETDTVAILFYFVFIPVWVDFVSTGRVFVVMQKISVCAQIFCFSVPTTSSLAALQLLFFGVWEPLLHTTSHRCH